MYTSICMYTYIHVYVYVCKHVHDSAYIYICMHAFVYLQGVILGPQVHKWSLCCAIGSPRVGVL